MGGASPCWARPRPWPGRSTIGPGWYGCWPGWAMSAGRRETSTAPLRRVGRPSNSRPNSASSALQVQAAYFLGQAYEAIGDFGRAAELLRWNVEAADREASTPSTEHAKPIPGAAGDDLGRARGLRRGPAPRGGGAPPRHAGRPRANTDHCPRLPRPSCTSPKGTWSTPSGCWSRAWPSVVPPATGPGCDGSRRAWALPMRSRGASLKGARC